MKKLLLLGALAACCAWPQQADNDPILRAMQDELNRSKTLKIAGVDAPYYIEYGLDDVDRFSAVSALGALLNATDGRSRTPRVEVRVGDYSFDNTNYMLTDLFSRVRLDRLTLDDDYGSLRHTFWLATDAIFKGAVEAIARKRAALKSITVQEKLDDFSKANPMVYVQPSRPIVFHQDQWKAQTRNLSAIFAAYPTITSSQVDVEAAYDVTYYVNSEGSKMRFPDDMFTFHSRASAQAADGMPVSDGVSLMARTLDRFPSEAEMRKQTVEVARNVASLVDAPVGEDYSGPVLMEGLASAQLFAQLVGANLGLTRRPVAEPGGRGGAGGPPASELEGRRGSRVLPEWMDAVDDPTQQEYRGHQLQGYYSVDMEAVPAKPVMAIEKGTVREFLLTRQPVRGFSGSNGHARIPGNFGAKAAVFSNLFIRSHETVSQDELKKKLLEMIKERDKPYGLIIRKLDYPSTGTATRAAANARQQRGGATSTVSAPVLVYRIYPDGHEQLVRGMRFRSMNVRSLRDINAASDTETVFDLVTGGGGYISSHTVVAPSVLFDDVEMEKREEDWPKLPIVAPPPLSAAR